MKFAEYRELAMRTNGCGTDLLFFVSALIGETGELVDELKKTVYHKHGVKKENLMKEMGDIMWAIAYFDNYLQANGVFQKEDFYDRVIDEEVRGKDEPEELIKVFILDISYAAGKTPAAIIEYCRKANVNKYNTEELKMLTDSNVIKAINESLYDMVTQLSWLSNAVCGVKLTAVMEQNIEKLEKRYKGSFSTEKSIKRTENTM